MTVVKKLIEISQRLNSAYRNADYDSRSEIGKIRDLFDQYCAELGVQTHKQFKRIDNKWCVWSPIELKSSPVTVKKKDGSEEDVRIYLTTAKNHGEGFIYELIKKNKSYSSPRYGYEYDDQDLLRDFYDVPDGG
jgi:hypothetical protein